MYDLFQLELRMVWEQRFGTSSNSSVKYEVQTSILIKTEIIDCGDTVLKVTTLITIMN